MPVQPTYPGVYIEEVPSGVRSIAGVSTSVTAFVGFLKRGPMNEAVRVLSFADFERIFGGLGADSEVSYAVQQFFLNGGSEAWVVRTAADDPDTDGTDPQASSVTLQNEASDAVLVAEAANPGAWGNGLQLDVDHETTDAGRFNLSVTEFVERDGQTVAAASEAFRNLSMDPSLPEYALDVVNDGSRLIRLESAGTAHTATTQPPAQTGTKSGSDVSGLELDDLNTAITVDVRVGDESIFPDSPPTFALVTDDPTGTTSGKDLSDLVLNNLNTTIKVDVTVDGTSIFPPDSLPTFDLVTDAAVTAESFRSVLEAALRTVAQLDQATVELIGDRLRIRAGVSNPRAKIFFSDGDADELGLSEGEPGNAVVRVQRFTTPSKFRAKLQAALRTVDQLSQATVELIGDRLRIRAGISSPRAVISFSGTDADTLGLSADEGAVNNSQRYTLGGTAEAFQSVPVSATDGLQPGAGELAGNQVKKTGMFALEDVDLFNILCIPRMAKLAPDPATSLISTATTYCALRRAFLIVDIPDDTDSLEEMEAWITENATLRHKNAATYFPRVMIADPLNGFRLKPRPASGTLAGLYARTDSQRGVWKAPAGVDANLRGVQSLEYRLTDGENGVLNPLGVNALRTFRDAGNVSWGARTLDGSNQRGSEWKYIPVRRTALFIEESLYRGTQWVVFEPNDESLWAQIRMNIGSFMQRLFQQGAFQGTSPRDAFFVKCDGETTTQDDIDQGIVNILVGFAPLKPAEFVIIKIQQIAGQDQG